MFQSIQLIMLLINNSLISVGEKKWSNHIIIKIKRVWTKHQKVDLYLQTMFLLLFHIPYFLYLAPPPANKPLFLRDLSSKEDTPQTSLCYFSIRTNHPTMINYGNQNSSKTEIFKFRKEHRRPLISTASIQKHDFNKHITNIYITVRQLLFPLSVFIF